MAAAFDFGAPFTRLVAPYGGITEGSSSKVRLVAAASAHPSHGQWPHMNFHRMPRGQAPYGGRPSSWYTHRTLCGPIGNPAEGPRGGACMAAGPRFRTPLTRIVALYGAPPKLSVAGSTWRPPPHFGTLFRSRAPIDSSTEAPSCRVRMAATSPVWDTPHTPHGPIGGFYRGPQWQDPLGGPLASRPRAPPGLTPAVAHPALAPFNVCMNISFALQYQVSRC